MDEGGCRNGVSLSLSLKRLTAEDLEGGLLYWVPLIMKGRCWGWVSLHEVSNPWELCEGNQEGGLPCWGPWRIGRWASLSTGALLGNLEGGSSTRDFERWMKEVLGMERFSLKRLSLEGLWGGLLYWGPWKIFYERLWIWASLTIWAPLFLRGTWN
jgi:hypothetical protein